MTETLSQAAARGAKVLARAGVPGAAGDARVLLAAAAGVSTIALTTDRDAPLPSDQAQVYDAYIARRGRARQPVSHILGERMFWGRPFEVSPDVLDPRPETECLMACALDLAPEMPDRPRVLDLGTGSGILALTVLAEWPDAVAVATDISDAALAVAARNAARLGVADRVSLTRADWFDGLTGPFDLILSNPPYIPASDIADLQPEVRLWEPRGALTPGGDGLDPYRAIAAGLDRFLAPSGALIVEHGAGQGADVAAILGVFDGARLAAFADLDGRARGLTLRRYA